MTTESLSDYAERALAEGDGVHPTIRCTWTLSLDGQCATRSGGAADEHLE